MMKSTLALLGLVCVPLCGGAATTIDSPNRYAYGANVGWMDWRGDTNNGAVIGEYVCKGRIYAANVGWINLGSGTPADGISYQNLAAGDFGVNNDGLGNLRGYAWGANIGWLNFETNGAPLVDLRTGTLPLLPSDSTQPRKLTPADGLHELADAGALIEKPAFYVLKDFTSYLQDAHLVRRFMDLLRQQRPWTFFLVDPVVRVR